MRSPTLSIHTDGLAELVFDAPDRSANVLTEEVMGDLAERLTEIRVRAGEGAVRGLLVRSGKPSSFILGADIDAIARVDSPDEGAEASRLGQAIFLDLERLPVPTLAAIHGACMGGGTELALACRYRVASDGVETRVGLPEVQLGILPAWGGTTRLPRLIGLRAALDLLLTGNPVRSAKAKRIGLVSDVLPRQDFAEEARAFLRARLEEAEPPSGPRRGLAARIMEETAPGRRIVLSVARRNVLERTGGHYPAPLRILEVVKASLGRPIEAALEIEASAAGELIASRVSKNLVHVYHLREGARKARRGPLSAQPAEVSDLGVVGAGTMGGGIAQLAALHGIRVRLKDVRKEALALGLRHASALFDSAVEKRKVSRREAGQAMDRISVGLEYDGFGPCDLVVEAVVERMDVKRSVFRDLESRVGEGCILATNTSSLSVAEMAEVLRAPGRLVGMHFFNPVHKMPLVEVVRAVRTGDRAVATAYELALRLGKVPVIVRDGPGFLVNRILGPYLNEAGYLLGEGLTVESIDGAMKEFGMPMGPLRLVDEVGIDIVRHAGETLHDAFGDRLAPAAALLSIGKSDRLGKKGGLGFYRYADGREAGVDPLVYDVCGVEPLGGEPPAPDVIRDRLVLAMVNEAARVLADGIAGSAGDLDLALIMGTGYPPFRGGLLRFADDLHPRTVVERLERYADALGNRFSPAPLLRDLAREERSFYAAFPSP